MSSSPWGSQVWCCTCDKHHRRIAVDSNCWSWACGLFWHCGVHLTPQRQPDNAEAYTSYSVNHLAIWLVLTTQRQTGVNFSSPMGAPPFRGLCLTMSILVSPFEPFLFSNGSGWSSPQNICVDSGDRVSGWFLFAHSESFVVFWPRTTANTCLASMRSNGNAQNVSWLCNFFKNTAWLRGSWLRGLTNLAKKPCV